MTAILITVTVESAIPARAAFLWGQTSGSRNSTCRLFAPQTSQSGSLFFLQAILSQITPERPDQPAAAGVVTGQAHGSTFIMAAAFLRKVIAVIMPTISVMIVLLVSATIPSPNVAFLIKSLSYQHPPKCLRNIIGNWGLPIG
jgi:hypothetical protein